jgi:hypothetical protein
MVFLDSPTLERFVEDNGKSAIWDVTAEPDQRTFSKGKEIETFLGSSKSKEPESAPRLAPEQIPDYSSASVYTPASTTVGLDEQSIQIPIHEKPAKRNGEAEETSGTMCAQGIKALSCIVAQNIMAFRDARLENNPEYYWLFEDKISEIHSGRVKSGPPHPREKSPCDILYLFEMDKLAIMGQAAADHQLLRPPFLLTGNIFAITDGDCCNLAHYPANAKFIILPREVYQQCQPDMSNHETSKRPGLENRHSGLTQGVLRPSSRTTAQPQQYSLRPHHSGGESQQPATQGHHYHPLPLNSVITTFHQNGHPQVQPLLQGLGALPLEYCTFYPLHGVPPLVPQPYFYIHHQWQPVRYGVADHFGQIPFEFLADVQLQRSPPFDPPRSTYSWNPSAAIQASPSHKSRESPKTASGSSHAEGSKDLRSPCISHCIRLVERYQNFGRPKSNEETNKWIQGFFDGWYKAEYDYPKKMVDRLIELENWSENYVHGFESGYDCSFAWTKNSRWDYTKAS